MDGYGRMIKTPFCFYEGSILNNKRNGYGIEIYQNSDIFIGLFKNDLKNG